MADTDEILRDDRALPPRIAAQYPFPQIRVELGTGARMHAAVVGQGEPVVLIHGNPTWSFLWRKLLPAIAEAGFQAIAPDHIGFGLSDKFLDESYYSIERHTENLGKFLDARELSGITLVVHDWGGPIGLGWAGRNAARIKRLVILNTLAFPPKRDRPLSAWHAFFASSFGRAVNERTNLLLETALRFGVAKRSQMTGDILDAYRFPFETKATRVSQAAFVRMVPNGPDHPNALTMAAIQDNLLGLRDKPAIVLWGDADPIFPKHTAEKWRGPLPQLGELKHYPRGGHFLQEDVPEELSRDLLAFLKSS